MELIRNFGKVLFSFEDVTIVGPYNSCTINHQVTTERFSVYFHKKNLGVSRQRISINSLKKGEGGAPIKSKSKTVNALVANFVHFVDGQICSFIIFIKGLFYFTRLLSITSISKESKGGPFLVTYNRSTRLKVDHKFI